MKKKQPQQSADEPETRADRAQDKKGNTLTFRVGLFYLTLLTLFYRDLKPKKLLLKATDLKKMIKKTCSPLQEPQNKLWLTKSPILWRELCGQLLCFWLLSQLLWLDTFIVQF